MSYRPVRTPEFIEVLCDLSTLKRWRQYVWLAHALFGSHAARVVVRVEARKVGPLLGSKLDEPGFEDFIAEVAVYDERGRPLVADLRLPLWQERVEWPNLVQLKGAAREAALAELIVDAYSQSGTGAVGSTIYRTNTPPASRWPPLYVSGAGQAFRAASEAEIELALRDLGNHNTWAFFTQFARDVYGSRAARIDVTGKWMEQEPDAWPVQDQRATAAVAVVTVADAGGTRLAPDLTTSWWQEWVGRPEAVAMMEEERAATVAEAVQTYLSWWPSMPTEQETYWVDTPPAHRSPTLYVREPFQPL